MTGALLTRRRQQIPVSLSATAQQPLAGAAPKLRSATSTAERVHSDVRGQASTAFLSCEERPKMGFKVAVIYYSRNGRLVTLANIIAEGIRQVEGADVTVYRVKDPIAGDDRSQFDHGVLDAPVATPEVVLQADCIVLGAPGRQGRVCAEMSFFLDSLRDFQTNGCLLKGKVGSAFTSVGEVGSGHGGHEGILQSLHSFFLQHGMLPVGVPPSPMMEAAPLATPLGTCMSGQSDARDAPGSRLRSLSEEEVKLAYSQGEWASIITKQLHDDGD